MCVRERMRERKRKRYIYIYIYVYICIYAYIYVYIYICIIISFSIGNCVPEVRAPSARCATTTQRFRTRVPSGVGVLRRPPHLFLNRSRLHDCFRKIECLLYASDQKGKMMIMIMKIPGSQVDSPVAKGNRKERGGRKMRDVHKDT